MRTVSTFLITSPNILSWTLKTTDVEWFHLPVQQGCFTQNTEGEIRAWLNYSRSPSLGACNYPIFLSRRLHGPIYFQFEFISNSDSHRNLGDQLQSQARTNVDMSTWCRHVHVRPHCLILTEACSCRLELVYFVGKISENRLVCKNALHWHIMGVAGS